MRILRRDPAAAVVIGRARPPGAPRGADDPDSRVRETESAETVQSCAINPVRLFFKHTLTGLMLLGALTVDAASIVGSKHDLSVNGPASGITASTETEVCIFCHTPHFSSTQAPLWNRSDSGATYTLYASSTTKATLGQPTGDSKLCLSCHDGTVALGLVRSRSAAITMKNGVTTLPSGRITNLGTDLSDDHPISFPYNTTLVNANGQLKAPPTTGRVHVDASGYVQCTACHDAHDPQYGNFLVMDSSYGALCNTCHNMTSWNSASHATATKTWNGVGSTPWPHAANSNLTTVAANACENCHNPHTAGGKARLLNSNVEESNCYPCHNGNVAAKNIQAEFNKFSIHPIASMTGIHDPAETTLVPNGTRHVECVDCHNPHASQSATNVVPGGVTGALAGLPGINSSGNPVNPATYEYEVCFRCHAGTAGTAAINRQFASLNTRTQFSTANTSYHPVEGIKTGINSPSLISPWTTSSIVKCTDCHSNDAGPGNGSGGTGPKGPHGSANHQLLERNLSYADRTTYVSANDALCFKCHDENVIFDRTKSFQYHTIHSKGAEAETACTTCHDPHGVATQEHLINFNTAIVSQNGTAPISYKGNELTRSGYCILTCHTEQHSSGDHQYP